MNENSQVPGREAPVSARRKLVRGVFAAPAALTLCSGSAFAAASNQRCVASAATAKVLPQPDTSNTVWVRLRAYVVGTNKKTSIWIKGSEVVALAVTAGTTSPFISTTQAICVFAGDGSSNTSGFTPGTVYNSFPTLPTIANGLYYAVLVDGNGNIVGISYTTGQTGGAVGLSCWASFK